MDLLTLVIVLALIGFALWVILTYVPMPDPIKKTIVVLVVVVMVLYVVRLLLGNGPLLPLLR